MFENHPKKLYSFNFTNWMVFYFFLVKLKIELSWYFYQFYHGPCSFSTSAPTCATTIIHHHFCPPFVSSRSDAAHAACPLPATREEPSPPIRSGRKDSWALMCFHTGLAVGCNLMKTFMLFFYKKIGV